MHARAKGKVSRQDIHRAVDLGSKVQQRLRDAAMIDLGIPKRQRARSDVRYIWRGDDPAIRKAEELDRDLVAFHERRTQGIREAAPED